RMNRTFGLELLVSAAACLAPIVAAYLLYYYGDLSTLGPTQNEERTLIHPAVPLPRVDGLAESENPETAGWGPRSSLLHVRTLPGDETCRGDVVRVAQVEGRLGRAQSGGRPAPPGCGPGWSLPPARPLPCDETWREDLVRAARAHVRLGRDQSRARRVYIGPEPAELAAGDPTLTAVPSGLPSYAALAEALE